MSDTHARLFVAVDPPAEVAERLVAWARSLTRAEPGRAGGGGARLPSPESLHLTLRFLGERPFTEIEPVAAAIERVAEEACACELELGAPLWLPARRPRALAVAAHEPSGALARLQLALLDALWSEQGDGDRPGRRFRPHITLARLRGGVPAGVWAALPPTPALRFWARQAVLYRSRLQPSGARYEALASADLGTIA
jgi:RNA 2',3'-cyclic 3'-phosphodiesterase